MDDMWRYRGVDGDVETVVTKAYGVKCPRCQKYTVDGANNYDNLCNTCCDVLISDHPQHPATLELVKYKEEHK